MLVIPTIYSCLYIKCVPQNLLAEVDDLLAEDDDPMCSDGFTWYTWLIGGGGVNSLPLSSLDQ